MIHGMKLCEYVAKESGRKRHFQSFPISSSWPCISRSKHGEPPRNHVTRNHYFIGYIFYVKVTSSHSFRTCSLRVLMQTKAKCEYLLLTPKIIDKSKVIWLTNADKEVPVSPKIMQTLSDPDLSPP